MGEYLDMVQEGYGKHLAVLLISILSGYALQLLHNSLLHPVFGTGQMAVVYVSLAIGALSVAGLEMWEYLADVPHNNVISVLTFAGGAGLHYLAHLSAGFAAVTAVGGAVFWIGALGSLANYYLRP